MMPEAFHQAMEKAGVVSYRYYESIGSTNLEALNWLQTDAADGSVVYAEHQSAGRGRMERKWVTQPKAAIAVSILLRPSEAEKERLALFSALAGVALANTLDAQYGIRAEIKWPNDVLIEKRKTSGILSEAAWLGDHMTGAVVGVGINITKDSLPPTAALQFPATWIQAHSNKEIDRYDLLAHFLQTFFYWRQRLAAPEFMNTWEKMLAFQGENVYIKGNDGSIRCEGILSGIEPNGDLRIQKTDGIFEYFSAGDVHLRPSL